MDRLQQTAAAVVEDGLARGRSNHALFHDLAGLGGIDESVAAAARPPRLTEPWFC
jgi:hypothetical protein